MPQANLSAQPYDRFNSVESVADQIFENMSGREPSASEVDAVDTATGENDPSNVVPLFQRAPDGPDAPRSQSERLWDALVFAFQERNLAALAALSQHAHPDVQEDALALGAAPVSDISFHEARRRSQLPDGIELLKGKPSVRSDDQTLMSIRAMVEEQEREQRVIEVEKKRAVSRQILAPLETPNSPEPALTPMPKTAVEHSFAHRTRMTLKNVFEKDIFLACSLSAWSALALMVFIDPALSSALFTVSAFLMFVASCLLTSDRAG